jgi:glutamate dehydrogenase
MKAILRAPVDLLWNGGIGTYVKASTESNAEAGDKANDAIRVDGARPPGAVRRRGRQPRPHPARPDRVRRGGGPDQHRLHRQLGRGRHLRPRGQHQDPARPGGRRRRPDRKQRNELLASMTDEVAALVLRDNYEQNLALANAIATRPTCSTCTRTGSGSSRAAGSSTASSSRCPRPLRSPAARAGEGLTAPELAVLLAWTKIVLAGELLDSDLPDDPFLRSRPHGVLPLAIRQEYRPQIEQHPLRREIIVTQVVNDLVNGAGMTFWPGWGGDRSASASDLTRANFVAREIFGSLELRDRDRGEGQPARRGGADPDAHRDAHPGRARVAVAGHQPTLRRWTARRSSTSSARRSGASWSSSRSS